LLRTVCFLSGSLGSYLGSSGHSKNKFEMIGNTVRDAVVGGTICTLSSTVKGFEYFILLGTILEIPKGRTASYSATVMTNYTPNIMAREKLER
jgi:hypothetical protein